MASSSRRTRRLFRKYALICALLVSVSLLASGGLQIFFAYQENRSAQGRLLGETAQTAAVQIRDYVGGVERMLASAADQYLEPPGAACPGQRLEEYQRLLRFAPAIAELWSLDGTGRERLHLSRLAPNAICSGVDRSGEPPFQAARGGVVWYGPVEFRDGSEPHVAVAVGGRGSDPGVIVADVNLTFVAEVVSQIRVGRSGGAYVVDSGGRLIADRDLSRVLRRTDLSTHPQVRDALSASTGVSTKRDATTATDLDGHRVLSAWQRADPPGWFIFVEQPLSEAFAPVYSSILRTAALLAAGLALAVFASLIFARRMVMPIRALQEGAARIGAGRLEQRIEVGTGDELETLADEFNRMSTRLQESYATLEQKVEARTRELEERSRQLAAADRAKSDFLSRMSHELRTPLNAIIGFAELMEMDRNTPEKQRAWVVHMLRSGRHLLGMINEVLDIARIEAGRLSLSPEPVPVLDTLGEIADLAGPLATERGIALRVLPAAGAEGHVLADAQRLTQILLNLVTNAIKYNRPAGSVSVSSEHRAGGVVRLIVADTGLGIPAEKIARLFTPFDRLDAEASDVEGTGLGLAIAQRLAGAMGGTLGVESEEGQGSVFWVELPETVPTARVTAAPAAAEVAIPERETRTAGVVLHIEDNLSNLQLVETIVACRPGVHLVPAMQGGLGLDLARTHHPDLILLDLNLPDMHGMDVLNGLRRDARTNDIPVVVVSADATPRQIDKVLAAGARLYLTKPVNVRQFLDTLDEMLCPAPEPAGAMPAPCTHEE